MTDPAMKAIVAGVLKTGTRSAFDQVLADAGFKIVELNEKGNLIRWQAVFGELHADAAARYEPGTRYEIALEGTPPFRSINLYATSDMNQVEPWTDTCEQTETHFRVGRYTVPLRLALNHQTAKEKP